VEIYSNISLTLFLLGLFLMVKNKEKKMFYGGILCLIMAATIWHFSINKEVASNLIGVMAVKNTRAEYIVEMRYFPKKIAALAFYQKQGAKDFSLIYRYDGDTKDWFNLIGAKVSQAKTKRLVFLENKAKQKTAYDEYQDFFLKYRLMPAYDSKQPKQK
jgi:hypothetical protein